MLRHRLPRYRRLLRDGEPRRGLILEVSERHAWTLGAFKWSLRLRVLGEDEASRDEESRDEASREFVAKADTSDLLGEFPHAGDIWPIRLDARRADVDFPALQAEILAERERIEAEHLQLGLARSRQGDG